MTDVRPPRVDADEKSTLLGFLDYLRASVAAKLEGLPDRQARSAGVPSGTNLMGLVKHLTSVELFYFAGEAVADWEATMRPAAEDTVDGVLAGYRAAIERSNEVIDAYSDLERAAPRTARGGPVPSMRWLLVHMIEETGRHAGHADILRERIDGSTGR